MSLPLSCRRSTSRLFEILARHRLRVAETGDPWGQRARFGVVGLLNVIVDVGLFNLLLLAIGKPLTAKLLASSAAIASSYVLNRRWTWRHRTTTSAVALPAFVGVALLGMAISMGCLFVSHYVLGLTSTAADNMSANVVGLALGTVVRYVLCDRWVFRRRDGRAETVDLSSLPVLVGDPVRLT